jgi:hypothetical protein
MSTRALRIIIASIVAAVLAGGVYLMIPWREADLEQNASGLLPWLFQNGLKFGAVTVFWLAAAVAIGTWVDEWMRG